MTKTLEDVIAYLTEHAENIRDCARNYTTGEVEPEAEKWAEEVDTLVNVLQEELKGKNRVYKAAGLK